MPDPNFVPHCSSCGSHSVSLEYSYQDIIMVRCHECWYEFPFLGYEPKQESVNEAPMNPAMG